MRINAYKYRVLASTFESSEAPMSKAITRRTVLAGTIVALLLVTGGFVAAATLGGITTTQTGQNDGSITVTSNTIFATTTSTTVNLQLVEATTTACSVSPYAATWNSGATSASVYMAGTAPCAPSTLTAQWFEELSWNGVVVPAGGTQSDSFFIQTTPAGSDFGYANFTISDNVHDDITFTGQLNVYLAAGSAVNGALPVAFNDISIAVSGT